MVRVTAKGDEPDFFGAEDDDDDLMLVSVGFGFPSVSAACIICLCAPSADFYTIACNNNGSNVDTYASTRLPTLVTLYLSIASLLSLV